MRSALWRGVAEADKILVDSDVVQNVIAIAEDRGARLQAILEICCGELMDKRMTGAELARRIMKEYSALGNEAASALLGQNEPS